ncbi:hypothetical protein ACQCT6_11965 [Cytobacillus gottheilii]
MMFNSRKEDQSFQVNLNSEYFSYTLQPNSAVTFKWDS